MLMQTLWSLFHFICNAIKYVNDVLWLWLLLIWQSIIAVLCSRPCIIQKPSFINSYLLFRSYKETNNTYRAAQNNIPKRDSQIINFQNSEFLQLHRDIIINDKKSNKYKPRHTQSQANGHKHSFLSNQENPNTFSLPFKSITTRSYFLYH